jgi:hypothetical protein
MNPRLRLHALVVLPTEVRFAVGGWAADCGVVSVMVVRVEPVVKAARRWVSEV